MTNQPSHPEDKRPGRGIVIREEEFYFWMGKVDTQLTQLLEVMKDQQRQWGELASWRQLVGEQIAAQNQEVLGIQKVMTHLQEADKECGEFIDKLKQSDLVTYTWIREKYSVPITLAGIVWLLFTVLPLIYVFVINQANVPLP